MDPSSRNPEESKKPSNSRFKQQKLGAWQPILTAKTVSPVFIVLGLLFLGVGVGLLHFSNKVQEIKLDYTECKSLRNSSRTCADEIFKWNDRGKMESKSGVEAVEPCLCDVPFELDEEFKGEVLMYYALTNFYQNHRKYIRSRDDQQMLGEDKDMDRKPASDCGPKHRTVTVDGEEKWYWPCGVIANSMFQDTIHLYSVPDPSKPEVTSPVTLIRRGIAWESDKKNKFKNPDGWNHSIFEDHPQFVRPKNWLKSPFDLDPDDANNNGVENEDFIIWMRTAALSNFRKLYRKVDRAQEGFSDGMPAGHYVLKVNYSYPVKEFSGTKTIIFSTTSLLGSKNNFLGIAYITVGSIGLVLGIIFIFVQTKYGKSTWNISHQD